MIDFLVLVANLQEAKSSDGGESLLGSVVKDLKSGGFLFIGCEHYPMPRHFTMPKLILNALDSKAEELVLDREGIVLETELPAA